MKITNILDKSQEIVSRVIDGWSPHENLVSKADIEEEVVNPRDKHLCPQCGQELANTLK